MFRMTHSRESTTAFVRLATALLLSMAATHAAAQAWPAKPVRMFVAGAAGSAPDIIVRLLADRLAPGWGQQVVVDNRPGAAGNLGTQAAARAPGDGYNLLFGQAAPLAMNVHTFKSLPFDVERDFVPVVNVGVSPMMIAVNPQVKANTLAELVALAKAAPGKMTFGTSSSRNIPHMTGAMLNALAGIELVHVPYKAGTQAAQETIAGETQIYIDGIPPMVAHMKSGRLRVLAVTSPARLPNFPEIPAASETLPGFRLAGWFAILAPTGTPQEVVQRVNRDVNAVLRDPEIVERLRQFGIYDPGGTPEELGRFMRAERETFGRAVAAARLERE